MSKRSNTEEFIKRANLIHDNKYNYSKCIYTNNCTKIIIICKIHGEFQQTPKNHLNKDGCAKCKGERNKKLFTKKISVFIDSANKIHNHKYDYSKFNYLNNKTKSIIICKIHGEFQQIPNDHLFGYGCAKCHYDKLKIIKLKSQDSFIKESNLIHNNKYDYSQLVYINDSSKVKITCPIHGGFEQKANNHLNGAGCPSCAHVISKKEIAWLNFLNIPETFRHKVIFINNKKYNLDALDINKKIIWEFYGDFWHGNPNKYDPNALHPSRNNKTYGQLYKETLDREEVLKEAGYTIISIWEFDWNNLIKIFQK